ncbi:Uma2 family endonuclease [Micromonospora sp. NPDC049230]|uniref:Uma2 family endonuclease n=1 Tax=Micromonospora sp. NPDC049230 TaxID=3155502 RepID=UPI0033F64CE7
MSAEAVGMHMPAIVTLDDVAAMNAADPNGHRYETSPEGVLSVMPPPDSDHAMIAVDDVVLVVEIVSPGSEAIDSVTKVREYASAGIPRYWVADRDGAQTVTVHRLGGDGSDEERARMPLAWLLHTTPADHLD